MSEYQYYEFRAVDRPLTAEQMSELRGISSRATITSRSFTNTYNYGSFRGDPRKLMELYFDAHVYVSNFGTLQFLLRLPRTAFLEDTLAQYVEEEILDYWTTDTHIIIEWRVDEYYVNTWMEQENWLDDLLSIREELMRGDFRSLYIGWLGSVPAPPSETATKVDAEAEDDEKEEEAEDDLDVEDSDYEEEDEEDEEEDEDSIHWAERWEPPVPAGLKKLTDAQIELARFLGIGDDLLAVAAEASPDISSEDVHSVGITEWVAGLSEQEMLALLVRIVQGDGTQVQAELQSEYYQAQSASRQATRSSAGKQRRTAASLATLEAQLVEKRKRQEREANERKRNAHLATLVPRFDALWARVHELATEQKSSGYTSICGLLPDMRDAYALVGRSQEFNAKLAHFTAENSRRTALIRKLKEAKLI